MKRLPEGLRAVRRTDTFTERSIPKGLLRQHSTRAGTWGQICVLEGALIYRILEPELEEHELGPGRPGVVEPQALHEVAAPGPVRFYVEFFRSD